MFLVRQTLTSSFIRRLLSICVLAPIVLGILYTGNILFYLFCTASGVLALYEWVKLVYTLPYKIIHLLLGMVYTMMGVTTFIFLRTGFEQGLTLSLILLLAVWATDIGGYVFGKSIGGPKLAPATSPNKTWSGAIGSIIATVIVIIIGFKICLDSEVSVLILLVFAILLSISGQVGDLFVSSYKRWAGVKDTGALIPGHGGILDRIDAWILMSPVFLAFILLVLS